MRVFADPQMIQTLVQMFSGLEDEDVSIVQMEQLQPNTTRQNIIGLDFAIKAAKDGAPVVMLGWMTPKMYIYRRPQEWFAVMGHPNVMFRRLPASLDDIRNAIEEVKASSRQPDPLAIALLGIDQTNAAVRVLHHDLLGAEKDQKRMGGWLERAKAVFGEKSQDELVALTKETGAAGGVSGSLTGQVFPDVCVDVEGTLLTSEGRLRTDVLALAEEKANGGPITVWTGGDVYHLTEQLRAKSVVCKIASKHALKGATVRVVIDDQPEQSFKDDYGVNYEEYVQV